MKKLFSLFSLFLLFNWSVAQQIKPFVVNSAGQNFSASSAQLNFNIGEIAITKISGTSNTITQGFLQPKSSLLSVDKNELANDHSVYPNPTSDLIHFKINNKESYTIKIIDAFGRIAFNSTLTNGSISLANYTNGLYQIVLTDKNQKTVLQTTISKIN
jgi:hypothetical protein